MNAYSGHTNTAVRLYASSCERGDAASVPRPFHKTGIRKALAEGERSAHECLGAPLALNALPQSFADESPFASVNREVTSELIRKDEPQVAVRALVRPVAAVRAAVAIEVGRL